MYGLSFSPERMYSAPMPLGVYLVPAHAYHVRTQTFGCERYFHKSLYRVGVQQRLRACGLQEPGNRGNIRYRAGFVIDQHQRNEYSIRAERILYRPGRYRTGAVGAEIRYLEAAPLQLLHGFAYRVVLHGGGDDMLSAAAH